MWTPTTFVPDTDLHHLYQAESATDEELERDKERTKEFLQFVVAVNYPTLVTLSQ